MGVAPIGAIKKALERAGMSIGDVDIVELNEAFAAQVLPIAEEVGIDLDNLNPHGGAIALGHPFGMTGVRIMTTLLNDLETLDKSVGIETMCVAQGQGEAMVIERLSLAAGVSRRLRGPGRPPGPRSYLSARARGAQRRSAARRRERQREQARVVGQHALELEPGRPRSRSSRSSVNFALISVRSSSRGANSISSPTAGIVTCWRTVERRRISIHSRSASKNATCSNSVGVEVGAELAVDHVQHVAVELRRDARRVVVRGLEDARVLDEVGAEQQVVDARPQQRARRGAGSAAARRA